MTRKDVQGELAKSTSRRVPSFRGWGLRGADLSGLHLSRSDFRGADCAGVDFTGAQMLKVNFEGADLRGAVYSVEQFGLFCGVVPSAAGRQHVPNAVWEEVLWDEVLPSDPDSRRLAEELLADWSGTIREALVAVEALRAACPRGRRRSGRTVPLTERT